MPRKSNQNSQYEVITQQDDNGDVLIPIPPMLLDSLKWKPGDEISFDLDDKGRYILKKVYK
jgi:bifunctional DNA-binding transcriptional regulator/antitoxin component of YhaV-PrlF toxin-antitoxin module